MTMTVFKIFLILLLIFAVTFGELYVVGIVIILYLLLNYIVPIFFKKTNRKSFLNRMAQSDSIFLTFDDGPHPESTPLILDLLKEKNMKATFFMVGKFLGANREIVNRINEEGHRLGSHSNNHTHAWKTAPWTTHQDLSKGLETLMILTGITDDNQIAFRPPFGKLNLGSLKFLSDRTAWWNVDPRDYECQTGDEVFERLKNDLKPGNVILLHDGRMNENQSPQATVEAVRKILEYGEQQGLKFSALPMDS